ncbi:MAG: protein-glutamate O-methyltransferase CheR [Spirochaetaceae bacterium]|nr:MAG: protein-glutamate O-methyltransferase CheR [Spirochaetaceae bacterium]
MSEFLSDDAFEKFRDLIYNESGIHFSSSNRTILESRLKERLRSSGLPDALTYYSTISADSDELKILLDSVTTNLTRFFRNTAHFETFEYFVIPHLIKAKRNRGENKLRIWSAGCSTGEEPYTIAMVANELLPAGMQLEVIASDISLKSLMVGKQGFYGENRIGGVPEHYLKRYFSRTGNGYRINDDIKSLVRFDYHNFKHDSGLRGMDVVFCRNVLIYFDEAAQKAAIGRFWDAMAPQAFLFIGHSESLFGMQTRFEFLKTDWACIYQKNTAGSSA